MLLAALIGRAVIAALLIAGIVAAANYLNKASKEDTNVR